MRRAWHNTVRAISPRPPSNSRLLPPTDPPSALFLERVRQLLRQPPGPDWEPVSAQEQK